MDADDTTNDTDTGGDIADEQGSPSHIHVFSAEQVIMAMLTFIEKMKSTRSFAFVLVKTRPIIHTEYQTFYK